VSSDGTWAEAEIRVTRQVVGSLIVQPEYSGSRPIREWGVALLEDSVCLGLPVFSLPRFVTFDREEQLLVEEVRADRQLTLVVRGDEYVFGCREGIRLEGDQEQIVSIAVTDRPLQIAALDLELGFGLELTPEISESLTALTELMAMSFTEERETDLDALLSEMAAQYVSPDAFEEARAQRGWDALLTTILTEAGASSGLSSRVRLWLAQAQGDLFATDLLAARLQGSPGAADHGVLTLESVSTVEPRAVGTPSSFLVDVGAEPEDRLRMGFVLLWQPARLLAELAQGHARQAAAAANPDLEDPDLLTVPQILTNSVGCKRVGTSLQGETGTGLEDCAAECIAELCTTALESMWARVVGALPGASRMEITANGPAIINRQALPISFSGAWVGEASLLDDDTIPVRGPFETKDEAPNDNLEPADGEP
jgi:hypothetical protein